MDINKDIQTSQSELTFKLLSNPTKLELEKLKHIIKDVFGEWDPKWFLGRMEQYSRTCLVYCSNSENKIIGFKVGYATSPEVFYSFIGGVSPQFRQNGIAKQMSKMQEDWCRESGFTKLTTKSMNRFKSMMIFNLKNEFDIVGTKLDTSGKVKVLFEKVL